MRQLAVIGDQQESLGILIQSPYRIQILSVLTVYQVDDRLLLGLLAGRANSRRFIQHIRDVFFV